jgi:hypothetical protein
MRVSERAVGVMELGRRRVLERSLRLKEGRGRVKHRVLIFFLSVRVAPLW